MQNSNLIKKATHYEVVDIAIEITRRCNRKCAHCLRGLAQKTTITSNIIDRIFEDVNNCSSVALYGGEVLLCIDMIEYLIEKIICSQWKIELFQLTSNGTIYDEKIISLLTRLHQKKNCRVMLRISGDEFHNQKQSTETFEKYVQTNSKNIVELIYIDNIDHFKASWRGREYISAHKDELDKFKWITDTFIEKRMISLFGNIIYSTIVLSANGNITFNDEDSYDIVDSLSIGNILETSLEDMILNNNMHALLKDKDFETFREIKSYINYYRYYKTESYRNYMRFKLAHKIYSVLWDKRKEFHQSYPHIKTEYIVNKYPMSDYDVFLDIDKIYDCVHYAVDSMSHTEWLEFIRVADKELYDEYLTHEDELSYDGKDIFTVYALYQKPDILNDYLKKEVYTRSNYFENVTCTNLV